MAAEDQAVQFVLNTSMKVVDVSTDLIAQMARAAAKFIPAAVAFSQEKAIPFVIEHHNNGISGWIPLEKLRRMDGSPLFARIPEGFISQNGENFEDYLKQFGIRASMYRHEDTGEVVIAYGAENKDALMTGFELLLKGRGFTDEEAQLILSEDTGTIDLASGLTLNGHSFVPQGDDTYMCLEQDTEGNSITAFAKADGTYRIEHEMINDVGTKYTLVDEGKCPHEDIISVIAACNSALSSHRDPSYVSEQLSQIVVAPVEVEKMASKGKNMQTLLENIQQLKETDEAVRPVI